MGAGLVAVVGLLGSVPTGLWATRSSGACVGCHQSQARGAHGHDAVSCQSCHAVRATAATTLSISGLLGAKGSAGHAVTKASTCAGCHDDRSARWLRSAGTEGHRKHAGVEKVDCLSCHATTSHGTEPAAKACLSCHPDARLHKNPAVDEGGPQCLACHNFLAPGDGAPARLTRDECARCHGPNATTTAKTPPIHADGLHGGVDCKLCHQPHSSLPAQRPCKSCHQVQILSGRPGLPPEHLECQKCHVQHQPVAKAGSQCAECHTQARASTTSPRTTALRHDECASCHLPHTWAAAPNDCVNCHAEQATKVATKSPARHQRCINCHEVHGEPPSGATCGTCHKENAQKMHSSSAPPKHQDCTGCHQPHTPIAEVPLACAECHKTQLHQVVSLGPAEHLKKGCDSCHTLHGDPKATTKACAGCHKNQGTQVTRAPQQKHQQCASCHLAHRFSFDPVTPSCSVTCHKEISPGGTTHAGACPKCHTPHGAPSVAKEQCLKCHDKLHFKPPERAPEHAKCASCHEPHTPATEARKRCPDCHEDKAKVAVTWPPRSAHREACHECHKPHDAKAPVDCGACHKTESTSALGGKHECKQCHAPHQTPAAEKKGWWGVCVNCHKKEVEASKRHEQCANCHKPHKYQPPACTSCHAAQAGLAAHLVKEHQQCTACHDAHGATKPTPAQCLACHKDRTNHEPTTRTCYACHPFK